MKSRVSEQLKELLQNMTQEQFDKDWAAIEALGFEGPTVESFIEHSLIAPTVAEINIITGIVSKLSETYTAKSTGEGNFAFAA
ncbi:MAG: hypothetical protein IPJ93_02435 [Bacteroidota bacterium]|nr:MAG: hypothetical protein IPJ93_02435 [Bacteroidota bacterium]HRF14041.1 hypothetical protein [Bacteroidia bacterium]